jgi:predicted regulator of Ras-like GTPase activity (Roadblock/LC7/MglB family)
MHWLAGRLGALSERHARFAELRLARPADASPPTEEVTARAAFFVDLSDLVAEIAAHDGVVAAFAEHDGLLVALAGAADAADAMAAMAATVVAPARRAAVALDLGPVEQLVLVGGRRKLALVVVGDLSIGILAPAEARLAQLLKR